MDTRPQAFHKQPLMAVCSADEFAQIARRVQFGEISWPQCWEQGEPLRLTMKDGKPHPAGP